jgi:hypothetical protein
MVAPPSAISREHADPASTHGDPAFRHADLAISGKDLAADQVYTAATTREKGREDGVRREGKGVVGAREQRGETAAGWVRGMPRQRRGRGVEAEGSGTWRCGVIGFRLKREGEREREEQRANEGGTGHGVGVTPHGGHGSERYQPDSIKYSVPNT